MLRRTPRSAEDDWNVAARLHAPFWRRPWPVAAGVLAVLLVVAAGVVVQLVRGAIELDIVRAGYQRTLESRLPAVVQVAVGGGALSFDRNLGLIVRAREVRLTIPGRAEIVASEISTTAETAEVLVGRFDPDEVTVSGLVVDLAPFGLPKTSGQRADHIRQLVDHVAGGVVRADDGLRSGGFDTVRIADAAIRYHGAGSDGPVVRNIGETVWQPLGPGRSKIWSSFKDPGNTATLKIERKSSETSKERVDFLLEQLPAWILAPILADPDSPVQYDAVGAIRVAVELDQEDRFAFMRARVTMNPGEMIFNGKHRSTIDGADFLADLGPLGDTVTVQRAMFLSGVNQYQMTGSIDLETSDKPIAFSMRFDDGVVQALDPDRPPMRLSGGGVLGSVDPRTRMLRIGRMEVGGPAGRATVIGDIQFAGSAPGIALAVQSNSVQASMVRGFWFPFLARPVRDWFDANVHGGTFGPALVQVAIPMSELAKRDRTEPLPDYAVSGSIQFRGGTFTPLTVFPAITGAEGSIVFENATTTVRLNAGTVRMDGYGPVRFDGSTMTIPRMGAPAPVGSFDLQLAGPVAAVAAISNSGPLEVAARRGVSPDAVSGESWVSLAVDIPLTGSGALPELFPRFRLELSEFASTAPIDGNKIGDANIVIEGSTESYTVKGTAVLDGIPANLDLESGSIGGGDAVTLTLDDETRSRLGFDLGNLLTGPVSATLADPDGSGRQKVLLDLKAARINLPFVAWEKGFGVPGRAEFFLNKDGTETHITDLVVSGRGFRATGGVLMRDGELSRLELDSVALRPGDDFAVTMQRTDGGYDVAVRGAVLDGRGLIGKLKTDTGTARWDIPRIRLTVALDAIKGHNQVTLQGVSGGAEIADGRIRTLSITGSTGPSQPFDWSIAQSNDNRVLTLRAANGGATLRFIDLYTKLLGGEVLLHQSGPASGEWGAGTLTIENFRVINERALQNAVQQNVARDNNPAREQIIRNAGVNAANVSFSRLEIPFARRGDVITIGDAFLRGPALGATGSGSVDLGEREVAISGTLVPAFGLNNIAGSIPIFGTILGGGRNEGLLGVTYRIFGPLDSPTLQMNPISAIAPGIFRKIFEFR